MKIDNVEIHGNEIYTDARLHEIMIQRPSYFLRPKYYHPELLSQDIKEIETFYHQNGYLEARVLGHSIEPKENGDEADIIITVEEGALTHIEGVNLFHDNQFPDSVMQAQIAIAEGEPFKSYRVEETTSNILSLYANEGYLEADTEPDITVNSTLHRAIIDYNVQGNKQYFFDEIKIEGLKKTKPHVITREIRFDRGDTLDYSRVLDHQERIFMLGIFERVDVLPSENGDPGDNMKNLVVKASEKPNIEYRFSNGYGTLEQVRGKVELLNNNFRGVAQKVALTGRVSAIYRSIEASFTEPWTFGIPLETDINANYGWKRKPGFDVINLSANHAMGMDILTSSHIQWENRFDILSIDNISLTEDLPDDDHVNILSTAIGYSYDSRDNMIDPAKGVYFETVQETGEYFTTVTNQFFRSTWLLKKYKRLTSTTVIATAVDLGMMNAHDGFVNIPLSERFYIGGPESLRGFEYQRVGPVDAEGTPIGGRVKLVWNVFELRQTIYKQLGGALFFDTGAVWKNPDNIELSEIRYSPGVGLRADISIGVARADYGFNVSPKADEPLGAFYFSLGHAF